ncbi:uncharacterized protein (TIGR01777 family) [Marisediminicola sp. UYEF4]|uniref:TIGR01777 family oxidoreductase n=1 Tax=Marisediminicola sp. UYEF4 TaxID=1756384 RepID=UPI0033944E48
MAQVRRPAASRARKKANLTVLVSGASGLVGTELVRQLRDAGHDVQKLVRRQPKGPDEHNWAPSAGMIDANLMDSMDAVINLSGASLGRIPWTPGYKKTILDSRLDTTRALAQAMSRASTPPAVFLSASAVGIYGDRPGERLVDGSDRGTGFLADVVEAWEEAARIGPEKTRLVTFRTGLVIGNGGGIKPLMIATKLGAGARMGTGGQYWPWISLYDEAAAIRHLLTSSLSGPVNLAGPVPATSDRLTKYLARKLHRPYLFAIPERVISLGMGEAGRELLLNSQKMVPSALLADGFRFRHATVESAIDSLVDER